jgi:hypothetical protein
MINAKLATPKKSKKSLSKRWDDNEKRIENICDYYDELQYNSEHSKPSYDNKCNNGSNQVYQLTKMRKDILNRKLLDYRERLKSEKLSSSLMNERSLVSSISSLVDTMTIPTFHFHLILSLTMMLLTHQCPQYLLVL